MTVQRRVTQSVPPTPGHSFEKSDDPAPLRAELARIRHEEWKRTSVGDGRGAAEAACTRMALRRGYEARVNEENDRG